MEQIIIVGGGVSGLSCGIRLREAGFDAQIWARDPALRSTSNVAAAVWYPYKAYPEHLVVGWAASTYAELQRLAREPGTGVIVREGLEIFPWAVEEPWWREAVPSYRRITPAELPSGYQDGYVFEAPVAEMTLYLPYLQRRFEALGGRVEIRPVHSFDQAFAECGRVVDCAGLGARELAGDSSMIPIRGQVVRVAQVGLTRFILDDYNPGGVTYIVPRINDCILGGTADEGAEDTTPDPTTAQAILERCIALEPRLREATVLEHKVGLRPGRPTVRLEATQPATGQLLVHNYGHGGAGVTLSWGCADEVVRMLERQPPSR